jgi:hypothetical protein
VHSRPRAAWAAHGRAIFENTPIRLAGNTTNAIGLVLVAQTMACAAFGGASRAKSSRTRPRMRNYFGLIFVILLPWMPIPAINPFWPNTNA